MSSHEPQPDDKQPDDDSGTYRISGSEEESASPQSVPPLKKKERRRRKVSPLSENPFEAEFARQERKAEQATRIKECVHNEIVNESEETVYGTKRTRIVDSTKKPSESLIASFLYPFHRDGIKLVFVYGFFIFVAQLSAFLPILGPVIQPFALMFVGIFVGLMLLETANDTIQHQGGGIEWPDVGLDSLGAGIAALAALLVATIPLWIAIWFLGKAEANEEPFGEISKLFILWGSLSLGLLYLPMSFIALAEMENEKAFNPFLVFSRIFQMFGSYIGIVGTILVLFLGLQFLLLKFENLELFHESVVLLTSDFIRQIAFVYLSTVLIRAVGLSFSKHGLSFEAEYEDSEEDEDD